MATIQVSCVKMFAWHFSILLIVLVHGVVGVNARSPTDNVPDLGKQQINERGMKILETNDCGEVQVNKDSSVDFGTMVKLNEFPFMALLKYNGTEPYQCSGTLITNRFVLTVAHCLNPRENPPIAVRLGEHDYSTDEDNCEVNVNGIFICNPPVEDFGIEKLIIHPLFRRIHKHHDIGLIRLDRDVIFKADEQEYIIAGWARREEKMFSGMQFKAKVALHSREYCQKIFGDVVNITDNHICAGGNNETNSCLSLSGGPLFSTIKYNKIPKYVQFGIVSSGLSCADPTIYTKIVSYLPWLTNSIAENES